MLRIVLIASLAALLASCASGPPCMPRAMIDRALLGAPGAAQPSKIVATEMAFARAAQEDGQWTAFRRFMARGAIIHSESGSLDAAAWLAGRADPPQAVKWAVRSVWMSCDGKLAVSRGRFVEPGGKVGTFVTVWQQQNDLSYKWVYDTGALDDPQPVREAELDDGSIVVSSADLIQGYVADCPSAANPLPGQGPSQVHNAASYEGGASPDQTLQWWWLGKDDGTRQIRAFYVTEGAWQPALDLSFPPAAADRAERQEQ